MLSKELQDHTSKLPLILYTCKVLLIALKVNYSLPEGLSLTSQFVFSIFVGPLLVVQGS